MDAPAEQPSPASATATFMEALGAVTSVMARSPTYCQYPIACIAEWLRPPLLLRQYALFYDASTNLVGYMTWAFLAEDTEQRLIGDSSALLHLSEWNEGDRLWIMDFVVLNGDVRKFIQLGKNRLSQFEEAKSLRRRDDGSIRKVTRWACTMRSRL